MDSSSRAAHDRLSKRVQARAESLTPALRRVAIFIDSHRLEVLTQPATQLAGSIGTSDATVIRAVKALGFDGLPELKRELAALIGRGRTAADNLSRTLAEPATGTDAAVDMVLGFHHETIEAMLTGDTRAQLGAAIELLKPAKSIGLFGIGPSALLVRYTALLLGRHGRRAVTLDSSGSLLADQLLTLRDASALLMLTYGRAYREAATTIAEAKRLKLPIIVISDSLDERLAKNVDLVVRVARGRPDRVALHGTTLICLEAIVFGLAASEGKSALATLERLNDLRRSISPDRHKDF
jgi:DNA-binding MurR/RpiR family transcriptional regulator